ncbi:MAG: hypothetical protein JKY96_02310 [Phycisphaerales bacterium]|nr:hypothetical protein [Phycisphaerales bacterium]
MCIQVLTRGTNSYELLSAQVVHKDKYLLIIVTPTIYLPDENDSKFWEDEPALVTVGDSALSMLGDWAVTHEIGGCSIIKYYRSQDCEEAVKKVLGLKAEYELAVRHL